MCSEIKVRVKNPCKSCGQDKTLSQQLQLKLKKLVGSLLHCVLSAY